MDRNVDGYSQALAVGLLIGITLILLYLFWIAPSPARTSGPSLDAEPECRANEERPCTANSCAGVQRCVRGVWSGCTVAQICRPGSEAACVENACVVGHRLCNDCGTGYGECIRTNNE